MPLEAYLDNSATTKVCEQAKEKMIYALDNCWGNPSSLHEKGIEAESMLRLSRKSVAKALSCDEKEIVFTSGGTEGNNLAVFGGAYCGKRNGNRVITTLIEHPSVMKAFDRLESEGFEVIRLHTDSFGKIDMNELKEYANDKTILVSVMAVNNEVGTIEPIGEIRRILDSVGSKALIHIDAVQAFGKIPLNVKKLGIDMMTVSSHKIHGPKGVGALYIRNGVRLVPVAVGGGQEKDIRPGTEPMPAIAGFGGAVEALRVKESLEKLTALRNGFVEKLLKIDGVSINSPEDSLPYIINISLDGLRSEPVLNLLSDMGIYISSGSACAKGHKSYVLSALGLDERRIDSSIRISLSRFTTEEELDYFIEGIKKAFKVIKKR